MSETCSAHRSPTRALELPTPSAGSSVISSRMRPSPTPSAGSSVISSRTRPSPKPSAGSTRATRCALRSLRSLQYLLRRASSTRPRPSSPPGTAPQPHASPADCVTRRSHLRSSACVTHPSRVEPADRPSLSLGDGRRARALLKGLHPGGMKGRGSLRSPAFLIPRAENLPPDPRYRSGTVGEHAPC